MNASKGAWNDSTTYKPVFISWLGCTAVFASSHISLEFIAGDPVSLTEYATATGLIWAIWLGRETKEAFREKWGKPDV
jgi:hypothetical protein